MPANSSGCTAMIFTRQRWPLSCHPILGRRGQLGYDFAAVAAAVEQR
jgi:hypothetical protein